MRGVGKTYISTQNAFVLRATMVLLVLACYDLHLVVASPVPAAPVPAAPVSASPSSAKLLGEADPNLHWEHRRKGGRLRGGGGAGSSGLTNAQLGGIIAGSVVGACLLAFIVYIGNKKGSKDWMAPVLAECAEKGTEAQISPTDPRIPASWAKLEEPTTTTVLLLGAETFNQIVAENMQNFHLPQDSVADYSRNLRKRLEKGRVVIVDPSGGPVSRDFVYSALLAGRAQKAAAANQLSQERYQQQQSRSVAGSGW